MIHQGQHDRFEWLVMNDCPRLVELTLQHHARLRLCISSFDSGQISPDEEEAAAGWTSSGSIMVSPPITESLDVPYDGYDEWYLLEQLPCNDWRPEVFVNYGGFTLRQIDEILNEYDPTWERNGRDWLPAMQERFWNQIDSVNPVTYVGMGDFDIVVSRRSEFIEEVRRASFESRS
jgi:hypothetical protein